MTLREVDPVRPGGLRWLSLVLNRGRVRSAPARQDRFVDPLFQANDRAKHGHVERPRSARRKRRPLTLGLHEPIRQGLSEHAEFRGRPVKQLGIPGPAAQFITMTDKSRP